MKCGQRSSSFLCGAKTGGRRAVVKVTIFYTRLQTPQALLQFLTGVDSEPLRLCGNSGDLNIRAIDGSLHNLLKRPQRERLCLLECHTATVTFLKCRLGALASGADRLCLPLAECAAGVGVIQAGPALVDACHEQRNAKGARHRVAIFPVLAEAQREVAQGLRARLSRHRLVVSEAVLARDDAPVVDQGARVGGEARHGGADVVVDFHNFLDGRRDKERRCEALLDGDDDAVFHLDAHGCRAEFDRFDGVLDYPRGREES